MSRSTLHFALAFVIFAASGIGYVLWYGAVSAQSARAAALASQIEEKKNSLNNIASTRAMLETLAGEEAAMQQYFVSEGTIVTFISGLQSQGQEIGSSVVVNSVSANTSGPRSTLTLSLTISGTFNAVMRTVGAIENAPYDLVEANLSLQNKAKNSWEAQLTVTVGSVPGGVTGAPSAPAPQTSGQGHPSASPAGG